MYIQPVRCFNEIHKYKAMEAVLYKGSQLKSFWIKIAEWFLSFLH